MALPVMLESSADFSNCSTYRYSLTRVWDLSKPTAFLIGLNPSTADHRVDDPTIRREIAFAASWGCGTLLKGNLFAFRSTDPAAMKRARDPVGPHNDSWLLSMAKRAGIIVCCWGSHGTFKDRQREVRKLLEGRPLRCFGLTGTMTPKHPLYLRADTPLVEYA